LPHKEKDISYFFKLNFVGMNYVYKTDVLGAVAIKILFSGIS
jgi:hypothetical protein